MDGQLFPDAQIWGLRAIFSALPEEEAIAGRLIQQRRDIQLWMCLNGWIILAYFLDKRYGDTWFERLTDQGLTVPRSADGTWTLTQTGLEEARRLGGKAAAHSQTSCKFVDAGASFGCVSAALGEGPNVLTDQQRRMLGFPSDSAEAAGITLCSWL